MLNPLLNIKSPVGNSKTKPEMMYKLFATPIFKSRIVDTGIVNRARDAVLSLMNKDQGYTSVKSWCTRDDLETLPEFKELTEVILEETGKVLDTLTIERDSHYITCMWSNVTDVGTPHIEHFHPNALYSGVIYLQTPPGSGHIFFTDPRTGPQMFVPKYKNPSPEIIGSDWSHPAEKGVMLVFPSWLRHGVDTTPEKPNEKRIALSFNIMIKSNIDVLTSRWNLK
jgi:uncharacterized protein (TIGR02466 family)